MTGGGTGGHVYPALAIASALKTASESTTEPRLKLLYVGSQRGMERDLVDRAGLPFHAISTGAFVGRGPIARSLSAVALTVGIAQALAVLRRHKVSAVVATGGYVSSPTLLAAWLARIPSMIYLPDIRPGLAVFHLSRFVRTVAVTSEHSRRYLTHASVLVTGYPLRPDLCLVDRKASRTQMGLADDDRLILVLGGSRGAHAINAAVSEILPELLERAVVVHASGREDEEWLGTVAAGLPSRLLPRYRLSAYLHEGLPSSMAVADIAISRAGASVLGEYPFFGLPSILVPYPYAGAHQEHNAEYLISHGAAVRLDEGVLPSGLLLPTLMGLLDDRPRMARMSESARSLSRPDAAKSIATELLALCSKK